MTADLDPAVQLAITEAVNAAEGRFSDKLARELRVLRDEYRTCATCLAMHTSVDKAATDNAKDIEKLAKTVDDLTKKVYMGVGIAALVPTAVAFILHFAK